MVSVIAPTNAVSRFAMPFFHRPIGSSIRKYSRSSRALRRDIGSILVARCASPGAIEPLPGSEHYPASRDPQSLCNPIALVVD